MTHFTRFQFALLVSISSLAVMIGGASLFLQPQASADQLPGTHAGEVIVPQVVTVLPDVANADLAPLDTQKAQLAKRTITLIWEASSFSPSAKEIESFLKFSIDGGQVVSTIDQAAFERYVAKVAKLVNRKAIDKKVTSDGEVLQEGEDGRKLNTTQAVEQLTAAFQSGTPKVTIPLTIQPVPFETKTVKKPFTPGLYDGKYVEVNLSTQRMYVFEGQTKVAEYVVSTGKWSMPTPEGTFSINNKVEVAYSARYSLSMPHWQAIIGSEYGIHGLPYRGSWIEGTNHLGQKVSHGCIRLSWANAEELYQWTEVGTVVYIHS